MLPGQPGQPGSVRDLTGAIPDLPGSIRDLIGAIPDLPGSIQDLIRGLEHCQGLERCQVAVMTTRSVKIIPVCNTDFFTKSPKFGLYLVCILRKSLYFQKLEIQKKTVRGDPYRIFKIYTQG